MSVSEEVYEGLYAKIGTGRISRFLDSLARPHVVDDELADAYRVMAPDTARENDASVWVERLASPTRAFQLNFQS